MTIPKHSNPYYAAQDILSRRDHSEFELRTKMKRKRFNSTQINDTVTKLKKIDLINDEKFTTAYIENVLLFKPVGPRWLAYKLKQKGIKSSLIESALTAAFTPEREAELARQAATTWCRSHPRHQADRTRLTRYLAGRGFSFAVIGSISLPMLDSGDTPDESRH